MTDVGVSERAGARAGYRETVLNFNFKGVSFSSRLNIKKTLNSGWEERATLFRTAGD